jgi:hypothetical protein
MGTVPVGAAGGAVTGQANKGMPVLGGQAGTNQFSPASGIPSTGPTAGPKNGIQPINTSPVASAGAMGNPNAPINTPPGAINSGGAMSGTPPQPVGTPPSTGTSGGSSSSGATPVNNGNPIAGYTPQQTQQLQKQLNDTYGAGEGGELFSLMQNLGSNDSSYMQAYNQAMSKQTAEGQATLSTAQGNAGISANSSTAAIENADYQSGVQSQAGLQEQQLLQTQQQGAINLTESTEGATAAENSTSWLNTLSQVVGIGAQVAGAVTGTAGLASLIPGGGGTVPSLSGSGAGGSGQLPAQLPGAISGGYAGPMPLSIG